MKLIQKSRLETFLKTKGYSIESFENQQPESQQAVYWKKSEQEKVILPRKDIILSTELAKIFNNTDLLHEFRSF